ncbi:hypothetical protein OSTOST_08000 [Ostertagia ostertagi]
MIMRSASVLICILGIQLASSFPSESLIGVMPMVRDTPSVQVQEQKIEHLVGVRNLDGPRRQASSDEFVGILSAFKTMSAGGLQTTRKVRKISKTQGFCEGNKQYYISYCMGMMMDRDEAQRTFLFRFCPWYENRCLHNDDR